MSGAGTALAALAGPSMLASASTLELFTVPLFHRLLPPLQPLVSFSMRQRYNSTKLRQRTEQFARAVPEYLHSNTHQQERGEFQNYICSRGANFAREPIRVAVAEIDGYRNESRTDRRREN